MLQEIRDRASTWVAYVIIGLLVLSFALWGIQEYFGGGAGQPVAKVNDNEITQAEFSNQLQQRKQMLRSVLGADYDRQYADESIIRKEVSDAGFQTSDESLINSIQKIPQFQTDGKFDAERYERLLQLQGYSKAQFESELREQGKLQQFEVSLALSSFMPKADLQRFQSLSEQTRDYSYALIEPNVEAVGLSNEEIEGYYQDNQQHFQTAEQVKLAFIELKEAAIAEQIEVTDEEARNIYDSQPERYMSAELRKTRHILLKVPNEVAEDSIEWDEALEKANSFIKQLNEGADFAELAKQHSEDTLSAEKGGDIGFIAPGDFTSKELDDALFSLNVGKHSKAIRTIQGVQIVYLDEIQASEQDSFENVSEQIKNERKGQIAQERFREIADEIANLVVELPDDLLEPSEAYELPIQETAWLATNSNSDLFAYTNIKNVAFSDDIITEKLNSELIEVADGHVIAFRLFEYKPSELRPLAEVTDEISNVLKIKKAAEQALSKGEELYAQMQSGKSLATISSESGLEVISHGALRRDDNRVPESVMDYAFQLAHPAEGESSIGGHAQANGSYALLELKKVENGSNEVDAAKALQLAQRVNYGRREFNAIVKDIQESANVQIFETTTTP